MRNDNTKDNWEKVKRVKKNVSTIIFRDENRQHPRKFWNSINQHNIQEKDGKSGVSEIVGNDGTMLSGAYAGS